MQIGIIREEKMPPDSRVPLTPEQCKMIQQKFDVSILVEPSPDRCYSNEEYQNAGINLTNDLSGCDVLLGVKEVPVSKLVDDKSYFFFSHTIKEQAYNRKLLQAILAKNIHLIDYEVLTNDKGQRLIAFGFFAGMVGAHNGILTYGRRTGLFDLKRMKDCFDYEEAKDIYKKLSLPPIRIVLTGTGRVASGAASVLKDMGIRKVDPEIYLKDDFSEPVFTQLHCKDYAARKDGQPFVLQNFFDHPENYKSIFEPYTQRTDILINGIYWDNKAPAFFTKADMKKENFTIKAIADVTCDIAPVASIPATLKASTIDDPVFGYDPISESETVPHQPGIIDMMTIDNLPNELPRDASKAFGKQFITHILHELLNKEKSDVINRATIAKGGKLGACFSYLANYVKG